MRPDTTSIGQEMSTQTTNSDGSDEKLDESKPQYLQEEEFLWPDPENEENGYVAYGTEPTVVDETGGTTSKEDYGKALVYVELLQTKGDAPAAIKKIFAQIRNDHANLPTEVFYRCHSDHGKEFINEDLHQYCLEHGIHQTSTAGYDPNANEAEPAVGAVKR